jgi:hypothetical protein
MQHLRDVLEKYVNQMPPVDAAKVIQRLRSTNNETFAAAGYEVLLFGYFGSRGYDVQLNVPLGDGDADLLVQSGSNTFFVEIATLFPSGEEGQRLALSDRVIDQLDAIDAPSYQARIVFADEPIPLDVIPSAVRAAVEEIIPSAAGPAREFTKSFGWATVSIEPRSDETDGFIVEAGRPHETSPLRTAQNALQRKVQHLSAARERGIPLVVALAVAEH